MKNECLLKRHVSERAHSHDTTVSSNLSFVVNVTELPSESYHVLEPYVRGDGNPQLSSEVLAFACDFNEFKGMLNWVPQFDAFKDVFEDMSQLSAHRLNNVLENSSLNDSNVDANLQYEADLGFKRHEFEKISNELRRSNVFLNAPTTVRENKDYATCIVVDDSDRTVNFHTFV